jgi:uncharacterized protein
MDEVWDAFFENGGVEEVQRLVGQNPGLLEPWDDSGLTLLMFASEEGQVGLVGWLLDQGATIDAQTFQGLTPLWYACCYGQAPVVRLLVERGADPTIVAHGGHTPLMIATSGGHLEIIQYLLAHPIARTTVNHRDAHGKTALWGACQASR